MKIWDIVYPVGMYYVAISVGITIAQFLFGAGNEQYMLCKILGSLVAIPVVYSFFKCDLIIKGIYGIPPKIELAKGVRLLLMSGIGLLLAFSLNNLILMSPLVGLSEGYGQVSDAFYGSSVWLELLGSALITPLLEEMLHRGVVFGRLRNMMGAIPAVVISSLIFAALHFNLVQFSYAFVLGIVLALFVEKTGHIYPAVMIHMLANALSVLRSEYGWLGFTVDKSPAAWGISGGLFILAVVLLGVYVGFCAPKQNAKAE